MRSSGLSDRHCEILEAAASLFAERGYAATSVRDIGERVGLLGGSLYHYIKSKEALFVRIHDIALQVAEDRIRATIAPLSDPWARLEAACASLLDIQLAADSLTMPMMNDFRAVPDGVRDQLVARRDRFEQLFRDLVAALPLPADIDRSLYRTLLLSQLNSAADWYRDGRLTRAQIAAQIVAIFRHDRL